MCVVYTFLVRWGYLYNGQPQLLDMRRVCHLPIGDGKQWMSWIHRTDLCNLINESVKNSAWSGVVNGVAPNPVRMNEFSNSLGQVLGRPSLFAVPGPILKLILGDGARVVLEGQNVKPQRLNKLKFKFSFPTINDAFQSILA